MPKILPNHRLVFALVSFFLALILVPVVIVFAATVPAEMNIQFTPIAIASGGTSTLKVSVFNLNANPLTNATWTDTFHPDIAIADPPNINVQNCGSYSLTDGAGGLIEAGDSSIKLTGATVPAQLPSGVPGECYVEVDVTSTTPGNLINSIPENHLVSETIDPDGGGSVPITNTTPASATLNVIGVESPSLSKAFAPNTVFVGQTSTLTINIFNNDQDYPLTEVTMFDELPTAGNEDIKVASPLSASLNGCGEGSGAELTDENGDPLAPDDTTIKLVNGTIAPDSNCTITVDVVSMVQGAYVNVIPKDAPLDGSIQTRQGVSNEDPADDQLNVQAFIIDKEFAETKIAAGEPTLVSIEIVNNATIDYTGAALNDILPEGLVFEPGSASLSCTDGSSTAAFAYSDDTNPNDTLEMTGGVLPAGTTCTITATAEALTSVTVGTYTNNIPIGALSTVEGATNHNLASADIEVDTLGITKDFAEVTIPSGGTSELTITISNPFSKDYTDADGGDPLLEDVLPAEFEFDTSVIPGLQGTGCTGDLSIGGTNNNTLFLDGGTLPANTVCTITATVKAESTGNPADPGDYVNEIAAGKINTEEGATNASKASDTISVQSLGLTKDFDPNTIPVGGTSTLTIEIINNGTDTFTGADLSDEITDTSFYFEAGTAQTTCIPNGVVDISADSQTISLTNGTIPPGGCTIIVDVTTDDNQLPTSYENIIEAGDLITDQGDTNPADASDIISVETVTITKSYGTGTISYPEVSTLTITISNPANGQALTNMSLTDTLPDDLVIATPANASTTCNDSTPPTPTLTAEEGTRVIELSDGSLAAGSGSCSIQVDVTALSETVSGDYPNTIGQGDLTSGPAGNGPTNGNTNTATLEVEALEVSKDFLYESFQAGDTSSTNPLTITLTNPTSLDYTNVNITDSLPTSPDTDLEFVLGTENTDCGGTVSLTGSSPPPYRTIGLAGGTLPANGSCTITVDVTTDTDATAGSYTNTIYPDDITTTVDGVDGPTIPEDVTADVETYPFQRGVEAAKSFTPSSIDFFDYDGDTSTLELEFTAPPDTDLTDFSFTDVLPDNGDGSVYLASPISANLSGCGANAELTDGSGNPLGPDDTTIQMINSTILKGETCTVSVDVTSNTGSTPGVIYTNTVTPDNVSNNEDRNPPGNLTANLTVTTPSTLTMAKDFDPNIVGPEGLSRLTITLENASTTELINVDLDDFLPGDTSDGVVIAANPNPTTTCDSGVITAAPGTQTLHMEDGTIPASDGTVNGICTINVNVQGKTTDGTNPATYTNTIPVANVVATLAGTPSTMNPQDPASDDLTVKDLDLEIVKGFDPVLVYGGADSEMSITLRNPNAEAELIDITFTDNMPAADMVLVDPPNFDPSDCGPDAELIRIDQSTFEFSGGYLAAGEECTITLNTNMTVNGNRTNTIPAEAVTTTNGATNKTPTDATLTNLASVSVSKSFEPNPIAAGLGSYSILTIEIRSTESVRITRLGLIDTLPAGLQVADHVSGPAPAPTNGCGGNLSAPVSATTIQLTDGELDIGFEKCSLTIPVTGAEPGQYTNQIPQGSITNDEGITNIQSTEDTLTLTPYSLGNRVWYDTDNDGIFDPAEVGISGVRVELYRDTNSNGVYDPGVDEAVEDGSGNARFEVTDPDGYYRFDDLGADDYLVLISGDNFDSGNPLEGYYSSGTTLADDGTISDSIGPDPDDDADNEDNGTTTATSGAVDYVSAQAVTLGPDQSEPTDDDDPTTNPETGEAANDQSNRTVDFGFYTITLGNLVWNDGDNSGAVNGSEAGIDGVDLELWTADQNTLLDTVTTGGGGGYSFTGLAEGNYIVRIPASEFQGTEPLRGFASSTGNGVPAPDGDLNTTDSDDNGSEVTPPRLGLGGYIQSAEITLTPGNEASFDNSTGTTSEPRIDFGVYPFPQQEKSFTGSDQVFTAGLDVAIGEILTYQVTFTVPPGAITGVTLTDTMDRGLVFDECVSITAGSPDLTSSAGDFATICSTPPTVNTYPGGSTNPADPGRQVIYNFGTLTNSGASDVNLVVTYQAVVLNNLENQSGVDLSNQAVWSWSDGTLENSADQVTVREPDLEFSKAVSPRTALPGQIVTFTLTVNHTAATETPAYDVVLTDVIPDGLTYVAGTLQHISGQAPDSLDYSSSPPTLTVVWDDLLNNGTNSVIEFDVTLDSTLRRGDSVRNSANLAWTSLPEDDFDPPLSDYNPLSVERDYDPASAVNIYGLEAAATIRLPALPDTGFAPGLISEIPAQRAEDEYQSLEQILLEIPALNLNMPVVSIPQNDQGWDLTWLWREAGWLEGTAYPTWQGNTVLTGHVYLANGEPGPFVNLGNLAWGDELIILAHGQKYTYQVREKQVVDADDVSILEHKDRDWLTVFTCQGYDETRDEYPWRQVVQAVLIKVENLN